MLELGRGTLGRGTLGERVRWLQADLRAGLARRGARRTSDRPARLGRWMRMRFHWAVPGPGPLVDAAGWRYAVLAAYGALLLAAVAASRVRSALSASAPDPAGSDH